MNASLFLLAFGLAADAFAVSLGQGAVARAHPWRTALIVGAAFGLAQAIAPLIGWALRFVLLAFVGGKMLWEGFQKDPPGEASDPGTDKPASGWTLITLAIAVSIDAAAAGITLPTLGAPIIVSIAAIGGVTFVMSAAGVMIGRAGAKALGSQAEIVGGLILIIIGTKVLFDHRAFG